VCRLNNNLTSSGFVFTFLGSRGYDLAYCVRINPSNNDVFVCGLASNGFPTTLGAAYPSFGGAPLDAFVCRLNSNLSGAGFISTYLGGNATDGAYGLTFDSIRNVIVCGVTNSTNFPTTVGAYSTTLNDIDAFITKFNNSLTSTIASTLLGGNGFESAHAVVVDLLDNIYVTGETSSPNFPFIGVSGSYGGGTGDALLTKFSPSLNTVLASRTVGGSGLDVGRGIVIAPVAGQVFIIGYTGSGNFPITSTIPSSFDSTLSGLTDAFIARFKNNFSYIASTYIGGNGVELIVGSPPPSLSPNFSRGGIVLDDSMNVIVTGGTSSSDFPIFAPITRTTPTFYNGGVYQGGTSDIFVLKITPDLRGGPLVTTTPLAPPTLRAPANFATGLALPPYLQWDPPSNAIGGTSYLLYLSTDAYPLTEIYSGSRLTYTFSQAQGDTRYYWYVVATDSTGRISWSTTWRFTTEIPPIFAESGSSDEGVLLGRDAFTKQLYECFIATAVYGSSNHPDVLFLKQFRDRYLLTNPVGRYLTEKYYQISPRIADELKSSPIISAVVRVILTDVIYVMRKTLGERGKMREKR
jgi:hypothetical protein